MEELWWSDLEVPDPMDYQGQAEREERFGVVFDEGECARGKMCVNSPTWSKEPRGAAVGPGLAIEDDRGRERAVFATCWYFPSRPNMQFCEDCVAFFEECDRGELSFVIYEAAPMWTVHHNLDEFFVYDWGKDRPVIFDTFDAAVRYVDERLTG
jgi:hypothetical protein